MYKWLLCSYILLYLQAVISLTAINLFTNNNACYYTSTDKYMKYQLNSSLKSFDGTIFQQEVCPLHDKWRYCRPFKSLHSVPCKFVETKYGDYIAKDLYCMLDDASSYKVRSVAYVMLSFNNTTSNLVNHTSNTSNFLKLYSDEESADRAQFCNCDWSTLLPTIKIKRFGRNITIIMKYKLKLELLFMLTPTVSLITVTNDTTLKEEIFSQVNLSMPFIIDNKTMTYNVPNLSPCKNYSINVNVSSDKCHPSYGVLRKRVPAVPKNTSKPMFLACTLIDSELTVTWSILPVYNNSKYYYKYGMSNAIGTLLKKGTFKHHGSFQVETNDFIEKYSLQICKGCLCGPVIYVECKYNGESTTLQIIIIAIVSLVLACVVAYFTILLIKRKYFASNEDLEENYVAVDVEQLDLDNQRETLHSVIPPHYEEPFKLYDHLNNITTKL